MEQKINFPGMFLTTEPLTPQFMDELNNATRDWTMRAARGECGWICSSCGCCFNEGMPDACAHGQQDCTDIIKRDKLAAATTR